MSAYKERLRRSFGYCGETCPAVDEAFVIAEGRISKLVPDCLLSDLSAELAKVREAVKNVGTEKMRDALGDACADLIAAEQKAEEAEGRIAELERELEELRREIREAA
ncbi:TPA: hypothetical protein QEF96_000384 [Stenotrophomonas maltophilia]|nr:hypothetical protein [Stenotrophomonas sp.]HDS1221721.1 hypothetical protein [Stenotrophomonas maltophilia]